MKSFATDGKKNKQSGEVMLEAAIILVPILIMLMVLLSLCFMFYQQAIMHTVASEIAADVAKNYKFTSLEMGKNKLGTAQEELSMFRLTFGMNDLEEEHKIRSETYAKWRIALTSLGLNPGEPTVDCKINCSGIGRAYVKITVEQKTDFFLSDIMEFAGITEENTLFSATAYAECSDLTGYTSMVNLTEFAAERLSIFGGFGNLYESIKDLAQKLT